MVVLWSVARTSLVYRGHFTWGLKNCTVLSYSDLIAVSILSSHVLLYLFDSFIPVPDVNYFHTNSYLIVNIKFAIVYPRTS